MIIFQNDSSLDLRLLKTFGANVKETENPIGYFGTGLKYALAVLMRTGHNVTLYVDDICYEVTTRTEAVRGKNFQFIALPDEPLAFTTELGKNWKMWMAFRELYSNVIDEDGTVSEEPIIHVPRRRGTELVVRGGGFEEEYHKRGLTFLRDTNLGVPIASTSDIVAYPSPSKSMFLRGVRVHEHSQDAMYTYDLAQGRLTEDRTLVNAWSLPMDVAMFWATTPYIPAATLQRVLLAPMGYFEQSLDYRSVGCYGRKVTEEFLNCVRALRTNPALNATALIALASFGTTADTLPGEAQSSTHRQRALEKATEFLHRQLDMDVTRYAVRISDQLPPGVLGMAHRPSGTIVVSTETFNQGQTRVIGTLMEEYLHLAHSLDDESRAMQNWLIDLLITVAERQA